MAEINIPINDSNPSIRNKKVIKKFTWNAVGAGAITALGIQLVFNLLGVGIGATTFDINANGMAVSSIVSISWILLSGIVAMYLGGWVTGKLSLQSDKIRNGILGLTMWGAVTLITFIFTFSTAGAVLNNTLEIAKQGLVFVGQSATSLAQAMPEVAETAKNVFPHLTQIQDKIVQSAEKIFNEDKIKSSIGLGTIESLKNELKEIVVSLVTAESQDAKSAAQEKTLSFLTNKLGFDRNQAEELATAWLNKYTQLKEQLAKTASEAKNKATATTKNIINYLGTAALITALAFIASAFASIIGAIIGGKRFKDSRRDY